MLRFDRKQQSSVKQSSFKKKIRDASDISCQLKFARRMARWMDGTWMCGCVDGCARG